ncbi:hypothetical protein MKW94_025293 [Papaver nudicaule]|uniref:Aspartate/glutamate/uridylate kinase domain-containing protein n=1 Tax=Papaver nudicaule TaxID=74823 RepID=A0AA42B2X6_PAPNU|nr:hypothetical protein [Papaver nudicaule]
MLTTRPLATTAPPLLSFSRTLINHNQIQNLSFPISCHAKPSKSLSCIKPSPLKPVLATNNERSAQTRVDVLSESLPFIQKFRGKTIVVKYGGAAMKSESLQESVINDLVLLSCVGLRLVFVHGGGPEINNGRLLTVRPSIKSAELGFVGDIAGVDTSILQSLIASGYIPVIASVGVDKDGQAYNINADTVAGELAAALGAEKLILLTDVAGILEDRNDPGSLVKEIDIKGVTQMVDEGKIAGGMIPKVTCCVRSIAQGVRTASIIDGRLPHSLLLEILTDEGAGTMITG